MDDELLETDAAAEHLGINSKTLRNWRSQKVGPKSWKDYRGRVVYPVSGLNEFMAHRSDEVGGNP